MAWKYKFRVDGTEFVGEEWPRKATLPRGLIRVRVTGRTPFCESFTIITLARKFIIDSGYFREETKMATYLDHPIWERGQACIGGQLVDKTCAAMTNQELADFIKDGAWRSDSSEPDESAYQEAAKRLRVPPPPQGEDSKP